MLGHVVNPIASDEFVVFAKNRRDGDGLTVINWFEISWFCFIIAIYFI